MKLHYIFVITGIVQIILMLLAAIVIIWNKTFSKVGRVLRFMEIIIIPVLGPIFILIEVLMQSKNRRT
jgi:fructose-specific phosphotransferase system IIC component